MDIWSARKWVIITFEMNESAAYRLVFQCWSPIPLSYAVSPNVHRAGSTFKRTSEQDKDSSKCQCALARWTHYAHSVKQSWEIRCRSYDVTQSRWFTRLARTYAHSPSSQHGIASYNCVNPWTKFAGATEDFIGMHARHVLAGSDVRLLHCMGLVDQYWIASLQAADSPVTNATL